MTAAECASEEMLAISELLTVTYLSLSVKLTSVSLLKTDDPRTTTRRMTPIMIFMESSICLDHLVSVGLVLCSGGSTDSGDISGLEGLYEDNVLNLTTNV